MSTFAIHKLHKLHKRRRPAAPFASLALAALLTACGGGGDGAAPVTTTAQPTSTSSVDGGSATFRVDATGDGLTYQWQVSADQQLTWVDITGANAASYVIALLNAALNGYWYRARVVGLGGTITSAPVQLTVTAAPPVTPVTPVVTLQSRLAGAAFYEPTLGVTIVANANLPASLPLGIAGIAADGTMNWPAAQAWVQALNASNYLGHADWRLPNVTPINGTAFQFNNLPDDLRGYSGRIDLGYNISAPGTLYAASKATELPYLFYNALGSIAKYSATGAAQDSTGNTNAPLLNVAPGNYWTSKSYGSDGAMAFDMRNGSQYAYVAADWKFNVMVLRDGDVGP